MTTCLNVEIRGLPPAERDDIFPDGAATDWPSLQRSIAFTTSSALAKRFSGSRCINFSTRATYAGESFGLYCNIGTGGSVSTRASTAPAPSALASRYGGVPQESMYID